MNKCDICGQEYACSQYDHITQCDKDRAARKEAAIGQAMYLHDVESIVKSVINLERNVRS